MDVDTREELRMLRSRAYGPDADIHRDPEAVARLEELERAHRAPAVANAPAEERPEPSDALTAPDPSARETQDEPSTVPSTEREPSPEPESVPSERERARLPWRTRLVWAASVVVAVAVAVASTMFVAMRPITPVAPGAGVEQVATLDVDEGFEWPEFFGGPQDDYAAYEDFAGMTVLQTGPGWSGGASDACLLVLPTESIDSETGPGMMYSGCGAGPFPPTIQLLTTPEMPEEFLERFPEGTAVQFVLADSLVGVFSVVE